jgi:hypothetical protein
MCRGRVASMSVFLIMAFELKVVVQMELWETWMRRSGDYSCVICDMALVSAVED